MRHKLLYQTETTLLNILLTKDNFYCVDDSFIYFTRFQLIMLMTFLKTDKDKERSEDANKANQDKAIMERIYKLTCNL